MTKQETLPIEPGSEELEPNVGETVSSMKDELHKKIEKLLSRHGEDTEVNRKKIQYYFDGRMGCYVLRLPDIDYTGTEAIERNIRDELFRISDSPDTAKKVFDKAVELAEEGKDILDIYEEAQEYAQELIRVEVEEEDS